MKRKYLLTLLIAFFLGAGLALLVRRVTAAGPTEHATWIRPTVEKQRPTIHIVDGKLVALKRSSINIFCSGTLDFIVENGSIVKKGDKLASVDLKSTEDELQKAQIDLSNEEANQRQAIINRDDAMPRLATSEKAQAANVELAELKLSRLLDQPDPLDWKSQKEAARLQMTRYKNSVQDHDSSAALFAQGVSSEADLRDKENSLFKASLSLASTGLDTLVLLRGAPLSQLTAADLGRRRAQLALENLRFTQANTAESLVASIRQEETNILYYKERIRKIQDDITKHIAYAPHDGLVELVSRHGLSSKIQIGDRVWNGSSVMMLTDLHQMRVRAVLHENYVRLVTPGVSKATVVIPSNPGKTYHALVTWIDRWAKDKGDVEDTAERKEIGMSGVQVFNIYVDITDIDEENLKPGRVAWIDIEPDSHGPVLSLPRGAIVEQEGRTFVTVMNNDQKELRQVSVLAIDEQTVQVLTGIDENTPVELKQ